MVNTGRIVHLQFDIVKYILTPFLVTYKQHLRIKIVLRPKI